MWRVWLVAATTLLARYQLLDGDDFDVSGMPQRCVAQMISDTCRATPNAVPQTAKSGATPVVFVAGIGMIDGEACEQLCPAK
jgi:hypothetical protein